MSKLYCDTKVLESNWYDWLVATSTPSLEHYRSLRILWTKALDKVRDSSGKLIIKNGSTFTDPCSIRRAHCIALAVPVFFESIGDNVPDCGFTIVDGKQRVIKFADLNNELNLLSDSWLHDLDNPYAVSSTVVPSLIADEYRLEQPTDTCWHAILKDISNMCNGIATKFNPPSEEERTELAHDALLQVTNKLIKRKLVFTPGRAPVFNLLTTTIYRCMYSIKNRSKNQRNRLHQLMDDMQTGVLPDNIRSFRAGMHLKTRTDNRSAIRPH